MSGHSLRRFSRKRTFHERTDALEEVVAHRRFVAAERRAVRHQGAAGSGMWIDEPRQVLFDRQRQAGAQRTFDADSAIARLGIAIVCVEQHARARLERICDRRGALKAGADPGGSRAADSGGSSQESTACNGNLPRSASADLLPSASDGSSAFSARRILRLFVSRIFRLFGST